MDLKERLTQAREQAAAEVARLKSVVDDELPAAQARLKQLDGIIGQLTPDIEAAYVVLKAVGVRLDN